MKTISILLIVYLGCSLGSIFAQEASTADLSLEFTNIQSANGNIHLAIYNTEASFVDSSEPYRFFKYPSTQSDKLQVQIEDLPPGKYALAVYHDVNSNDDLDKNLFGIPKEPYGFSNNPKAKWSAPKYKEIVITFAEAPMKLSIFLKKWKHR